MATSDQGQPPGVRAPRTGWRVLNPTTYLITLPERLRLRHYLFWPLLGALLYLIFIKISRSSTDAFQTVYALHLIVVSAAAYMGITANVCARWLDGFLADIDQLCDDPEMARANLKEYVDRVFALKPHLLWGVVWCLGLGALIWFASAGYTQERPWYDGRFGHWPFVVNWAITSYVIGAGAQIVFGTMLVPRRLAREQIKLNLHAYKRSPIRRLSNIFIFQSLLIFGAALHAVFGVVSSPNTEHIGFILMYCGFLWLSFLYFLVTQWGIHQTLIKGKLVILDRLAEKFEEELARIRSREEFDAATEDRANRILALRREVVSFPDWTINPGNFSAIAMPSISGTIGIIYTFWDKVLMFLKIG